MVSKDLIGLRSFVRFGMHRGRVVCNKNEAMASSIGVSVPSARGFIKEEAQTGLWVSDVITSESVDVARASAGVDKDFLCPICFQTMEDAFVTNCGHSFCYTCITTHLNNRSNCPSCARYLTSEHLIPNFLLSKVSLCTSAIFKRFCLNQTYIAILTSSRSAYCCRESRHLTP